ncbi:MAG: hypothetical protein KF809_08645 [Chloroflexi bacterium]|nr:hypothetical protein [Chloroflexota bacterium]
MTALVAMGGTAAEARDPHADAGAVRSAFHLRLTGTKFVPIIDGVAERP